MSQFAGATRDTNGWDVERHVYVALTNVCLISLTKFVTDRGKNCCSVPHGLNACCICRAYILHNVSLSVGVVLGNLLF